MTMQTFAGITLLSLLFTPLSAQSPSAPPTSTLAAATFEIADVHTSPPRRFPFVEGGTTLRGDRLVFHQATMVDLIAAAYGIDPSLVQGGPIWLETDRFEVRAKAPPTTPKDTVKLMLQSLLADRFKLVVHSGTAPLPAYVLTVGKDKPKLKEADDSAKSDCQYQEPPKDRAPGSIPYIAFVCHNTTMDTLATNLQTGPAATSPNQSSTRPASKARMTSTSSGLAAASFRGPAPTASPSSTPSTNNSA
jgi:uncharacterized protein (TIGR03435 family)